MSDVIGGDYHRQRKDHAARWDERQQAATSERSAVLTQIAEMLPANSDTPLHILDIGAGDGAVSGFLLDRLPKSQATLVDFSEAMMEKGRTKLVRFGARFRYIVRNMNEGGWPADLDAAASSAAIHHLQNDRKEWLGREIRTRLREGGVFADHDLFRSPTAIFAEDEVHDRTCAATGEVVGFLSEAGYDEIVVAARRPKPARKGGAAPMAGFEAVAT